MTTDPFTTAARAEAESWIGMDLDDHDNFVSGAVWARDHLDAQEPTDAEIEAAAEATCSGEGGCDPCFNWDDSVDGGCTYCTRHARAALSAARAARRDEEDTP